MLKRLGLVLVVMIAAVLVASPAFAQDSLADRIINRTFNDVFASPSQSQYDRPTPPRVNRNNLPPQARQALCGAVVRNRAVPLRVQRQIKRQFGLSCKPAGSFLSSLFSGFPFSGRSPF